jgi:general secretion pathway protein M
LLTLVDRTVKQAGLSEALKRVEPDGESKVKVRLENAVFDATVGWLESMQQRYSIRVESISIDAQDNPGTVNIRLTLSEAA